MKKVINIIVIVITIVAQAVSIYCQFKAALAASYVVRESLRGYSVMASLIAIVGVVFLSSILLSGHSTKSNIEENK